MCKCKKSMDRLNVIQLKQIAKEKGVKRYSQMIKAELIEAIKQPQVIKTDTDIAHKKPINPVFEKINVEHMRELGKEYGIKKYYWMNRHELIEELNDINLDLDKLKAIIVKITPTTKKYECIHGNFKYQCKECHGSQICNHNRIKSCCKECKGGSICEHKRNRYICKDCKGKGICIHGKQRWFCKLCGGTQICKHKKQKAYCKECC